MQSFAYERPSKLEDAVRMMASGEARALAGGTDLIAQLKEGRRSARVIVDLKRVPELGVLEALPGGGWRVGAAASIARLGQDATFARAHGALLASARLIGSLQIQSRASLGGNLANAAPSADAVPLLVSLGAMAEIAGPGGRRTLPAESFAVGPGRTALAPGELLVALLLPPRPAQAGACYLRFTPRREMDIAIAGAGVALSLGSGGEIATARITLAAVGPVPLRARRAEARLIGAMPEAGNLSEAARIAAEEARPISDTRGSADYRRHLVEVLSRRALEASLAEAGQRKVAA